MGRFRTRAAQGREHRTAVLVAVLISFFFAGHTLPVLNRWFTSFDYQSSTTYVPSPLSPQSTVHTRTRRWQERLVDVSNLVVMLNSLLNPIIYFIFSRGFSDFFLDVGGRTGNCAATACATPLLHLNASPSKNSLLPRANNAATPCLPFSSTVTRPSH